MGRNAKSAPSQGVQIQTYFNLLHVDVSFLATLFIKLNVLGIITIGKYSIIAFRDTKNERDRCPVHAQ